MSRFKLLAPACKPASFSADLCPVPKAAGVHCTPLQLQWMMKDSMGSELPLTLSAQKMVLSQCDVFQYMFWKARTKL